MIYAQKSFDMLDAIGGADHAEAWIDSELAAGHRLMGFGHRIYRVRDPRADALGAGARASRRSGATSRGEGAAGDGATGGSGQGAA